MKNKILLIDIDGTVCEDIKNEDSHLYADAKPYLDALEVINSWYDQGAHITFFTARESKDKKVTEEWLNKHGFKYHGLITDKPRMTENKSEYVWIDNRKVRGITYTNKWSNLVPVTKEILTFKS
jgi:uncharacterized HAD superfamily protein